MRTRVKICGLTRAQDAEAAVAAGADALGVVLATGPRRVSLDEAERVFSGVPPFVARVGVFVDASEELVAEAAERLALSAAQFHGDESPERCANSRLPVIKALRIGTRFAPDSAEPFRGAVSAILLDSLVAGADGGTGIAFAWRDHATSPPGWAPLVLAGGLHAGNVAEAIGIMRPYAVDVSSGVESAPGIKDPERIRAFVRAVAAANREE